MCSESMSEPGPTHALSQENTTTRSKKLCSPGYMRTALSLPSLHICAGSSHSEERSVAPRTLPIYCIISSKQVRDDVHHREKHIEGKRGKESPKIEAEKR